ncbi:hypothetical protein [Pseudanabaena sp. FACHB-2040]|uniref:hypothetical protein n=1 Tax=Pseudanabaena sp. FACHB-2040 TaxID=2692859 RepID=UPI00168261AF|nr:hypothetical protein [Pseudanabaena sp. FACHB-2040]MBD2258598.1 hypothetical protein [Pseudanabaena sp. FACHB-2040]
MGLSLDEAISLHEKLIEPLRAAFDLGGIFYFSWVLPMIGFLGILAFFYLRFLLDLSLRSRRLFLLASGMYISGAIGVEMINGLLWESANAATPLYGAFTTLEEFLEMIAISIFIYALLAYLSENLSVKIFFDKEKV